MASKPRSVHQRQALGPVTPDAVLQTNEQLIKSRFYSWALASGSGWQQCAENVARKTGVEIPIETFRQNFKPKSAKRGARPRRFGTMRYLRAIYDFVCAEGYLSGYTLATPDDAFGTALALNDYIGAAGARLQLEGCFRSEVDHGLGSYTENFELSIVPAKQGSVPSVLITETTEVASSDVPVETVHRQGWMVSNADGMVLVFTRHAYEGAELYLLLQSSPTPWAETAPDVLAMLRYDAVSRIPLALGSTADQTSKTRALIPKNALERSTLILTRVGSREEIGGARGK